MQLFVVQPSACTYNPVRVAPDPRAPPDQSPMVASTLTAICMQVSSLPPVYLSDSPGVMVPRVNSTTEGLKLALTSAVREGAVPDDVMVDYILYHVNSIKSKQYLKVCQYASLPGCLPRLQHCD